MTRQNYPRVMRCCAAGMLMALPGAYLGAEAAAPCPDQNQQRRAYFGDLHVHTSYSQDANWRMGATNVAPDDAYRFARGDSISLPPFDAAGNSVRSLKLARPLDFAMVADHAEAMDLVRVCSSPEYASHDSWACGRNSLLLMAAKRVSNWISSVEVPCAEATPECRSAKSAVWKDTIDAAENHQDDCNFTAFIGYEWSATAGGANLHRNVVFRSNQVPRLPISAIDEPNVEGLWNRLDAECRDDQPGCDSLTIPHNSNLSQGKMFSATMSNGEPLSPAVAEQRSRYERLAEIIQHKGASECYYGAGISKDELCAFEQLPYSSFAQKYVPFLREPPADDSRYLREALRLGLRLERDLGVNPFVPGFIGSTDTHVGAAGAVAETANPGHHGAQHISGDGSSTQLPDRVEQNAGGLAVLYAEENTRDSLFSAMRRREAYATSGPRIQLRFFGGWEFPENLCDSNEWVSQAYASGVPMGATLTANNRESGPSFVVAAHRDPGSSGLPGTPLQKIQVVKAWIDAQGNSREAIYDVAGDATAKAGVDLSDCSLTGTGHNNLCTVWRDPDFNPETSAFYYTRVLENPSCRWQQRICANSAVSCDGETDVPEELAGCCDASVPKTINERAWSSPIWYRSPAGVR